MKKFVSCILTTFLCSITFVYAQIDEQYFETQLKELINNYPIAAKIKQPSLSNITIDNSNKSVIITISDDFSYQPLRPNSVNGLYNEVKKLLPKSLSRYQIQIISGNQPIENLIPNAYLGKNKIKDKLYTNLNYKGNAWVENTSLPYEITKGLQNRHIALWQSHGAYYKNDANEWGWQRPYLFCTTEDLFTQSFVVPYIIPMLQNAGAYIFTPRERDTQRNEVIVDNDIRNGSIYLDEKSRKSHWQTSSTSGFAQRKQLYYDNENPFNSGTARFAKTEKKKDKAFASWIPTIPVSGSYAVYVSYQTLPNSVSDAKYIVLHAGGITEFKVNQQIGGGTWVYLGTFDFEKGNNPYGMVVLTNESKEKGVISADAVRFGGGMGNIVRGNAVSGYPRYLEGARYTAQWSGMPYDVYSGRKGENDYIDDINTRSQMMNYLSGGSVFNPAQQGLGVPFEMSMGVHSDAGYSATDEVIGTLGIYTTDFNNGQLAAGTNRFTSRDLSDLVLTQIESDIKANHNVNWTRRAMWNRNYSESRIPSVASTIVELMSHQNFADMKLGHDPNFKFTLSRAIYKATLKYLSQQHGVDYVVQPLPISNFAVKFGKKNNTLELSWKGENDPLESTATPEAYIVYMAKGNDRFDNGVLVKGTSYTADIEPGIIYSFKIAAVNKGGLSFPSETLSAYKAPNEKSQVLIVNGFNRLSGPAVINTPTLAGFDINQDPGVAYHQNISLSGAQLVFDRKQGGKEGKNALGFSGSELEGKVVAGNTFNYPYLHGKAIQAAGGYSFVSCSDEAVENGKVQLENYPIVDLILGLEKEDANDLKYYKTFSSPMQRALTSYASAGGNILVSGSYVGSDMSHTQGNRTFTEQVLKYQYVGKPSSNTSGAINGIGQTITIPRQINEASYAVTSPDCIYPVGDAFSAFVYDAGNESAGIAYKGNYRTFVLGFPFESIQSESQRAVVMASILNFFTTK